MNLTTHRRITYGVCANSKKVRKSSKNVRHESHLVVVVTPGVGLLFVGSGTEHELWIEISFSSTQFDYPLTLTDWKYENDNIRVRKRIDVDGWVDDAGITFSVTEVHCTENGRVKHRAELINPASLAPFERKWSCMKLSEDDLSYDSFNGLYDNYEHDNWYGWF